MRHNELRMLVASPVWVLFENLSNARLNELHIDLETATGDRLLILQGQCANIRENLALRSNVLKDEL